MAAALNDPVNPGQPGDSTDQTKETSNINSSSSEHESRTDSEQQHEQEIINLARKITEQSLHENHQSPFTAEKDSCLDPASPNFRWRDWAKAFYNVRYNSGSDIPRKAGFAFKNLSVWGKGSPTDFQTSVGNAVLKLPSLFGRGHQKIDILRHMDGLLLAGEQLCVLGPPG